MRLSAKKYQVRIIITNKIRRTVKKYSSKRFYKLVSELKELILTTLSSF